MYKRQHRTWLRTGDRGLLEPGGARGPRLRLVGRSKEIVNRGGEKVSPLAVEDVLLRHAAVKEVAWMTASPTSTCSLTKLVQSSMEACVP